MKIFFQKAEPAIHAATTLTALFLTGLIIYAEETPVFKNWLKATFTHHWLGKGALALVVFAAASALLYALWHSRTWSSRALARLIVGEALIVTLSTLALLLFFLAHALPSAAY